MREDKPGFWEQLGYHNYGDPWREQRYWGTMMWHIGTVVALHDETATARTITLTVPDWPGHLAGQHVDVRLTAADGYTAVRSYSIASAPTSEGRVEITVERLPDGEVSPYLTQEVAVGERLELRGPIGGWFVWHAGQTEPIQLIAGGSGIVPLMAMIRSRATAGSAAPFRLLYSVREPAAVLYGDELRALSDHDPSVSLPTPTRELFRRTGRARPAASTPL